MTKPTWIFVAGPYRSGSTTQYEMARDIVEKTNTGIGIGYHNERRLKEFDALDWNNLAAVNETFKKEEIEYNFTKKPEFNRASYFIVCKVFEFLPGGFRGETSHGEIIHRQERLKAVVSVRDPRDIITSMKERSKETGEDAGRKFNFEKTATEEFPVWLGNAIKWADLGPEIALVSKFEDFTQNLVREVRRIANHLRVDLNGPEAKTIAKQYKPENLRKRKDEFWQKRKDKPELREDRALPSIPALKFASSGQWRDFLTEEEAAMVYKANKVFFERFGYEK